MAEVSSAKRDGRTKSCTHEDKLFDPSIEMLLNEFDDERTLEEEEALAAEEPVDASVELSILQRESDMPIDELLALYGYRGDQQEESSISKDDLELSKDYESEADQHQPSKLEEIYKTIPDMNQDASRLLRSVSRVGEEEDEDYDYSPDEEDWHKTNKTIMVGSDYQAQIPDGLCHYGDALPYENDDKLLWNPYLIKPEDVENYLRKAATIFKPSIPVGNQLKDDEQALYLLQQCGHNTDEALRRLRMNVISNTDSMSLWSEEECRNFESGIRSYGKNFHVIQQNKVRTRSVGELVQFYYLWKKSERHDIFASKTRLEKKKYTLHPGVTDFMDRFLEDQDGRDRSSSPNVQNVVENKVLERHRSS
ncbi:mesoderm induction early response protein 1 [Coccinella septempunctata]|uniref:mesoderm induction early response protein 1 n=1 Tax=Coccinella septempunctata TaxID=41139 RepID=UPI001D08FCFC|nr:mesoderm induction early response protein 1 [Coccinella septempunctata]